jgi:hypothetical protein
LKQAITGSASGGHLDPGWNRDPEKRPNRKLEMEAEMGGTGGRRTSALLAHRLCTNRISSQRRREKNSGFRGSLFDQRKGEDEEKKTNDVVVTWVSRGRHVCSQRACAAAAARAKASFLWLMKSPLCQRNQLWPLLSTSSHYQKKQLLCSTANQNLHVPYNSSLSTMYF